MQDSQFTLLIEVPSDREINDAGARRLVEQTVKHQGLWRIHLNDADPWPSDPHGDRQDAPEKLSLLSGSVFSKKDRSYLYSLSNKAMRFIHAQIMKSNAETVCKKLASQSSLIEYLK